MIWLIIFFGTFSTAKCDGIIQAKILTAFVRQFRALQPLPISYNTSKETKIALIKSMSEKDSTLDWIDENQCSMKFLLVISQSDDLFDQNEETKIDQEIYYLTASLDLYEKYTVNNIKIKQKLGHFVDGMYIKEKLIEQNFLKRRQNFHGCKLIATINETGKVKVENLKNAPYFSSNETYDVTGLVKGSYFDIWTTLQHNLNFTTVIYRRKVVKWGVPVQHPNGSISVPDGIVKDGMDGLADILLTSLYVLHSRYLVIDYLTPIDRYKGGIFTDKDSIKETFDFEVFHKPFDKWTWTTMISSSFTLSISIFLISKVLNLQGNLNCLNFIDIFEKSLKANFGNASFEPITDKFQSLQMVIFVAMIIGNIIWIAYNGALLSKLIEPRFDKPFQDLESLAKSNYR